MPEQHQEDLPPAPQGMWIARVRMRLSHALAPSDPECRIEIAGRGISVRSVDGGPLYSSPWIFLTADGFANEAEARGWANALGVALFAASARTSLGVEFDREGLQFFETGNDPSFGVSLSASGRVNTPIPLLFDAVSDAMTRSISAPDVLAALELFSLSGVAQEPLSRAVLCLSAVELLAGQNKQGKVQKCLNALFTRLGLPESDKDEFDAVYTLRCAIVHGDSVVPKQSFIELADRARAVCQKIIVLAAGIP